MLAVVDLEIKEALAKGSTSALKEHFEKLSGDVLNFVTSNYGTLDDARKIYSRSWLQTWLLLIHDQITPKTAVSLSLYSLARIHWKDEMRKRKIDPSSAKFRSEYLEYVDQASLLTSINEWQTALEEELIQGGETCRKLLEQIIGEKKPVLEVGGPLGYKEEQKCCDKLADCILSLIGKFEDRFKKKGDFLKIVQTSSSCIPEKLQNHPLLSEKQDQAAIIFHLIRINTSCKKLIQIFNEWSSTLDFEIQDVSQAPVKKRSMATQSYFATITVCCIVVSAATGFITAKNTQSSPSRDEVVVQAQLTSQPVSFVEEKEEKTEAAPIKEDNTPPLAFPVSSNGFFITSLSSIKGTKSIHLKNNHHDLRAEIIYKDSKIDLALIRVTDQDYKSGVLPYRIASSMASIGQDIIAIGGENQQFILGKGYIFSVENSADEKTSYLGTLPREFKSLGAPVFSANGNLVGFTIADKDAGSKIIASTDILSSLEAYQDKNPENPLFVQNQNRLLGKDPAQRVDLLSNYLFHVERYY